MASKQELQVQQKRELEKKEEPTVPARVFEPMADIYETADALTVVMEMPGVDKGNLEIRVEEDVLKVKGKLDSPNTRECSRSTPNTTSATMPGASAFRVASIRTISGLSLRTGCSR
jgi:HSP20 family molecular chaperone IbpA